MRKEKIDISTEEKRNSVLEAFKSFTSKNQAHIYFGVSDNKQGSEYIKRIATEVGFDIKVYQKKKVKYCKECGKEITSKYAKYFCSTSCATKFNNKNRDSSVYKKIGEVLKKDREEALKKDKVRHCIICGKELTSKQIKYCSPSCCNKFKYKNDGKDVICLECGKVFKSGYKNRKFCSYECSIKYKKKRTIEKWLKGEKTFNSNSGIPESIREYLFQKKSYQCEECGFEGYNKKTNKTILQIHHIDGNSDNNSYDNLQVLCPNCHAMTENYMNLNKGNSARTKRYK